MIVIEVKSLYKCMRNVILSWGWNIRVETLGQLKTFVTIYQIQLDVNKVKELGIQTRSPVVAETARYCLSFKNYIKLSYLLLLCS